MNPVLEFENVSFSFDGKNDAISGISLRIDQGERVGLVGGNGAGKSTLLWCALGLLHHRGTMRIFGQKRNPDSLRRIGMVFQNPEDQLFMPSLVEDLILPLMNRGMKRESAMMKVSAVLDQVGLSKLGDRPARQLSLGQRKRAAIAAALVDSPDLLILDEPTAELDGRSRKELALLLQALPVTTVIASHDLEFLARTVERITALENGRLCKDATVVTFMKDIAFQEQIHLL